MDARPGSRRTLAALLSLVQPGLGHLYLREWVRALVWVGVWVASLAVVVVTAEIAASTGELLAAVLGVFSAAGSFPLEAVVSMFAVTLFASLDAYWLAGRDDRRDGEAPRCPHCRKPLDPTLEFCHWCTAALEGGESA